MSNVNIFQNTAKTLPKSDAQIVRVSMEQDDISARKSHMPAGEKSGSLTISHVPNTGSTVGK